MVIAIFTDHFLGQVRLADLDSAGSRACGRWPRRLQAGCRAGPDGCADGGAIGRKLDFLLQEMNREANTIGSKGNDLEQARTVVEIKAELEKIREQIQNIE